MVKISANDKLVNVGMNFRLKAVFLEFTGELMQHKALTSFTLFDPYRSFAAHTK